MAINMRGYISKYLTLYIFFVATLNVVKFMAQEERVYTGSSRISVTISILSNVVSVALTLTKSITKSIYND